MARANRPPAGLGDRQLAKRKIGRDRCRPEHGHRGSCRQRADHRVAQAPRPLEFIIGAVENVVVDETLPRQCAAEARHRRIDRIRRRRRLRGIEQRAPHRRQKPLQFDIGHRRDGEKALQQSIARKPLETAWAEQLPRRQPRRPGACRACDRFADDAVNLDEPRANRRERARSCPWLRQGAQDEAFQLSRISRGLQVLDAFDEERFAFGRWVDLERAETAFRARPACLARSTSLRSRRARQHGPARPPMPGRSMPEPRRDARAPAAHCRGR